MMLVGLALADLRTLRLDARFLGFALAYKHLVWPALAFSLIAFDRAGPRLFDTLAASGLWIASLLPMAANTVAFAALFDAEPEKTSLAVVASTLLAVALLPLLATWL
jgi:predicted permease